MRTIGLVAIAIVTSLTIGATSVALAAADPTQADFDACNSIAQSKATNPSASPQTGAAPSAGPDPQAAPSPERASQVRLANQADQLRGMADAYKNDVAYQQAYRDCMKNRGF
jgi:ABC-type Na+ efflux pump permease subunit